MSSWRTTGADVEKKDEVLAETRDVALDRRFACAFTLTKCFRVLKMTPAEAKQLIDVLARGIDPQTGEMLPEDNVVHNPPVIRALFLASRALELQVGKPMKQPIANAGNAGKPWTQDEDLQLAQTFDAGTPVAALAKTHQRTPGAITSRLIRLGRLQINADASQ